MKLPKAYQPAEYENDIYMLWQQAEVFTAKPDQKKERFSIAMPPPNETGTLSLGHGLFLTLQDIMVRFARQQGQDALWLPGTDHAALAVNAIIEKQLAEEGTNKHELGREAFLQKTRDFVGNSRETMLGQMRAMGASADWSRLRYTLDDALSRCVTETFIAMYSAGAIYRGHRIVNWDPNLETNVSDDEIEYAEEQGSFYTFQYGPFQIGTARPETKFGDKYVVVHPDDDRYKEFKHGQTFECEWINGPITATVIKDDAIDMEFGTGAMTITPWHDHTDFDIAERHQLDKEQIIDFKGVLLPIAGEFAGMHIEEARPKIVEKLREKGLLVNESSRYTHNVAINERGKGKIEPQIRLQWFVDVNKPVMEWKGKKVSFKKVMRAVIDDGDIAITPKRFEKIYFNWIDNLRDWCISRQIWWGHRIPAWYRDTENGQEVHVGHTPPSDDHEGWHEWEQDPDTLDTWFSSALWTWSTLVDPDLASDQSLSLKQILEGSQDFKTYHPTSVLETGHDIIFFWVARMILSTTFMTGQVPFKNIYLHGMINAEDGKKMSKSRPESIIDPLTMIGEYGTDALRIALIWGNGPGNGMNWSTPKIQASRNFCNKLWNIARFIEDKAGSDHAERLKPQPVSMADHWIISKLDTVIKNTTNCLEDRRFSEAFDGLYHFLWDDVADWYLESSKSDPNIGVLSHVLEASLILLHPFAPFVTETIWQTMEWEQGSVLALQPLPKTVKANSELVADFEEIRNIVTEARHITAALQVRHKLNLYFSDVNFLRENAEMITHLARLKSVGEVRDGHGLHLTQTKYNCWLDVDHHTAEHYLEKLRIQEAERQSSVERLKARLANKSYVKKAPKEMVEETKQQLKSEEELLSGVLAEIQRFGGITTSESPTE